MKKISTILPLGLAATALALAWATTGCEMVNQATSIAADVPGTTAVAKASAITSWASRFRACRAAISSGRRVSSHPTASSSAGTRRPA